MASLFLFIQFIEAKIDLLHLNMNAQIKII